MLFPSPYRHTLLEGCQLLHYLREVNLYFFLTANANPTGPAFTYSQDGSQSCLKYL